MNYELNQQQYGPRYCLQGYTTTGKLQKPPPKKHVSLLNLPSLKAGTL